MMFKIKSAFCVLLPAMAFTVFANGKTVFQEHPQYFSIRQGPITMIAGKTNCEVNSLQIKRQIFLSGISFICQRTDGQTETEKTIPAGKIRETVRSSQNEMFVWSVESEWKFLNLKRTVTLGNFPGFKFTYEFDITEDFTLKRLYLKFVMPKEKYQYTGYLKKSVMQFRKAEKSEWFGILRNSFFPYITFFGKEPYGVMILAADRDSWDQLPTTLLYNSGPDSYSSTEFIYFPKQPMKKGDRKKLSFYIIPVSGKSAAADAADIYAELKNNIR